MKQMTIYDEMFPEFKITKPIRLIELFAGYGSQAMALERLGADFTHHKVIEFDRFAVNSYNAVHGTNFEPTDIRNIHASDLEITDTDKYCYIMTYSFPCTDLSVAGKMKGMKKGSGTRSGLLWEVERLLKEMNEKPQVLLMENVTQVHGKANIEDFRQWISFLESIGYQNFWQDLNAKNYGVAQNRNRCFMVSFLGNYSYDFPQPIPLKKKLKDYLEDNVDEKYYINNEKAEKLIKQLIDNGTLPQHNLDRQTCGQIETWLLKDMGETADKHIDVAVTLRARDYKGLDNYGSNGVIEVMVENKAKRLGNLYGEDKGTGYAGNVWDIDNIAPTLTTSQGGQREPMITESQIKVCESQIVAMRGRNPDNPSDRTVGSPTEQRLEVNMQGTSNCLTSVQKDNLLLENVKIRQATEVVRIEKVGQISSNGSKQYRIRKLTPRECGRLMGVSDEDITKMEKVNSNAQLYKQFGNSIVVDVLCAIFKQLNIKQEKEKNCR